MHFKSFLLIPESVFLVLMQESGFVVVVVKTRAPVSSYAPKRNWLHFKPISQFYAIDLWLTPDNPDDPC